MKALDKAISLAGGTNSLAKQLGVKPNVVCNWRSRGVPPEYCPPIERATDRQVLCEHLNDKVDWAYLRGTEQAVAA